MLPTLLVTAALIAPGAPVPRDLTPNTTGPAPRIVAVKADANGAVWIMAQVYEKRKVQQQFFIIENGKQVMKQQIVEQNISNYIHKSLGDFGAKFTTADGKPLTADDATKSVKSGATLLVAADGKPIDKGWLRAVSGDAVVMQVEGLAHAFFQYNQISQANSPLPTTASPRLALLCADEKGAVNVAVNPGGGNVHGNQVYYNDFGNGRVVRNFAPVGAINVSSGYYPPSAGPAPNTSGKKLLTDVKFDAYDLTGKLVPKAEALKRLKAGGLVLLAGDSQFPDANYLRAFRDDVLVLVSGEFVFPQGVPNPYDMPVKPAANAPPGPGQPAVPIMPAMAAPVPVIAVAAPALPLRVAPAVIRPVQIAPAAKPAAVKPAPKPADKPAKAEAKPAAKPVEAKPPVKP
jgi:hypothetical protein